jgi:hypothetical protein
MVSQFAWLEGLRVLSAAQDSGFLYQSWGLFLLFSWVRAFVFKSCRIQPRFTSRAYYQFNLRKPQESYLLDIVLLPPLEL